MGFDFRRGDGVAGGGETGDVGAEGEVDAELVLVGGLLVVLGEALADFAGGDADDGVCVGVVVAGAEEDVGAEIALFEDFEAAGEGLLDDKAEEGGVTLAVAEVAAFDDAFKLQQEFFAAEGSAIDGDHIFTGRYDQSLRFHQRIVQHASRS